MLEIGDKSVANVVRSIFVAYKKMAVFSGTSSLVASMHSILFYQVSQLKLSFNI